jgi:hypothetical protein
MGTGTFSSMFTSSTNTASGAMLALRSSPCGSSSPESLEDLPSQIGMVLITVTNWKQRKKAMRTRNKREMKHPKSKATVQVGSKEKEGEGGVHTFSSALNSFLELR